MAIILYGSRLSPFVEKVYCGLMLKQIPFHPRARWPWSSIPSCLNFVSTWTQ